MAAVGEKAVTEAAPDADEKKAAKRKEIEERLAALKLQQQKEADQKTMYFGEHPGITCDGCGAVPLVGYRYKCKQASVLPALHSSLDCTAEPQHALHTLCRRCYASPGARMNRTP